MRRATPICAAWGDQRGRRCVRSCRQGGQDPLGLLALNLCTAFVASRVIGLFEHSISQLVALAALMPIVAGIGGNTGNQTITMIVRALALQHVRPGNVSFLLWRELGVALINGLVWGGTMGVATYFLYQDAALGAVMTLAMVLNLLVAALMGVIVHDHESAAGEIRRWPA